MKRVATDSDDIDDAGAAADSGESASETSGKRGKKPQPPRSAGRRLLGGLGELVFVVVGALIISAVLRSFVAQMFIIPSGSMMNTLLVNDRVLVSKVSTFHRGDIVVFTDPGGWLTGDQGTPRTGVKKVLEQVGLLPSTSNNHLIKRVIGLPGDEVKCCDAQGRLTVNGVALDESAYLYVDPATGVQVKPASVPFDVVVPADHIWVMGDHRNESYDSRCHLQDVTTSGGPPGSNAFVPESDVVGPAIAIAAPLDRFKRLTVPATFKDIPAPSGSPPAQGVIKSPAPTGAVC